MTTDLSPPALDLSETVAAQPPANALLMVERYAQRMAWAGVHQTLLDSIRSGQALYAFLDQFPLQRTALVAHYVRSLTAAYRALGDIRYAFER